MEKSEQRTRQICEQIARIAADQHLSNVELARRSGISYRTIYDITHGKAKLRRSTIESISRALGVSLDQLIGGSMVVREDRASYDAGSPQVDGIDIPPGKDHRSSVDDLPIPELIRQLADRLQISPKVVTDFVLSQFDVKNHKGGGV